MAKKVKDYSKLFDSVETKPKETKPKEMKPKEMKPKEMKPKETKPKETKPKYKPEEWYSIKLKGDILNKINILSQEYYGLSSAKVIKMLITNYESNKKS